MELSNNNIYRTLLHCACQNGHLDVTKYLISLNEIDVLAKDEISYI